MRTPYSVSKSFINPKTKKTETKTEWKLKLDERNDFIKKFSQKRFDEVCLVDERMNKLRDIEFPKGTSWLFNHFYAIWKHCEVDLSGNRILTPRTIMDYCECFGVNMTFRERQLMLKMHEWATESITQVRENKDE